MKKYIIVSLITMVFLLLNCNVGNVWAIAPTDGRDPKDVNIIQDGGNGFKLMTLSGSPMPAEMPGAQEGNQKIVDKKNASEQNYILVAPGPFRDINHPVSPPNPVGVVAGGLMAPGAPPLKEGSLPRHEVDINGDGKADIVGVSVAAVSNALYPKGAKQPPPIYVPPKPPVPGSFLSEVGGWLAPLTLGKPMVLYNKAPVRPVSKPQTNQSIGIGSPGGMWAPRPGWSLKWRPKHRLPGTITSSTDDWEFTKD